VNVTVDASVAVKWVLDEPGHEAARALLVPEFELHAPELFLAEVGNVLWKRWRRGELDADAVVARVWKLRGSIDVLHSMGGLLDAATAFAIRLNHPIYDCFYLACAEREETPLLTADRRLHAAALRTGLTDQVRLLG